MRIYNNLFIVPEPTFQHGEARRVGEVKEAQMNIDLKNLFQLSPDYKGKYSQYHLNGIPTHLADGSELMKSEMKKLAKEQTIQMEQPCVKSTGAISDSRQLVKRVLDSNPLLDSFGNTEIVRNDNSSRFGKFVQLQWHVEDLLIAEYSGKMLQSSILAGSFCLTYL